MNTLLPAARRGIYSFALAVSLEVTSLPTLCAADGPVTTTVTTLPAAAVDISPAERRLAALESLAASLAEVQAGIPALAQPIAEARQRFEQNPDLDHGIAMLEATAEAAYKARQPCQQVEELAHRAADLHDEQVAEIASAKVTLTKEIQSAESRVANLAKLREGAQSAVQGFRAAFADQIPVSKRQQVARALFTAKAMNRLAPTAAWGADEMRAALDDLDHAEGQIKARAEELRGVAARVKLAGESLAVESSVILQVVGAWRQAGAVEPFLRQGKALADSAAVIADGLAEVSAAPLTDVKRRSTPAATSGQDPLLKELHSFSGSTNQPTLARRP